MLDETKIDALKEVGNVGVGNAATALSKLISRNVEINIPDTSFIKISKFCEMAGGEETIVNCLYIGMQGEIEGEAILFFNEKSTKNFIDLLMEKEKGYHLCPGTYLPHRLGR